MIDYQHVLAARQQAANTSLQVNFMQQASCQHLLDRLSFVKQQPNTVLIIGAQVPSFIQALSQRFPTAAFTIVDIADTVLAAAKPYPLATTTTVNWQVLDVSVWDLPLNHFDLIVSPLLLHWLLNDADLFLRLGFLLTKTGFLFFNTYGPKTFNSVFRANPQLHNPFQDMHHLGDAMLAAKLGDPVLDVEHLSAQYETGADIISDLQQLGYLPLLQTNSDTSINIESGQQTLAYEFIYGHALGTPPAATHQPNDEAIIDLSQLKRKITA